MFYDVGFTYLLGKNIEKHVDKETLEKYKNESKRIGRSMEKALWIIMLVYAGITAGAIIALII